MNNFSFKDLFDFDKMITPKIIKVIYILFLGLIAIFSLIMIITGLASPYGGGGQVFMGIIFLIVSPLIARVHSELLIIIFKIYQKLSNIDAKLNKEDIM